MDKTDRQAEKKAMKELEEKRVEQRQKEKEEVRSEAEKRQKEMELMRMKHEEKMLSLQQEFITKSSQVIEKKKLADRMAKLEDNDQPEAYFHRYEETMKEAEIPMDEWPQHLRPLLTGKALASYSKNVPGSVKSDYYLMKEALLDSLGLTVYQLGPNFGH